MNPLIYYYKTFREKVIDRISSLIYEEDLGNVLKDPHRYRKPRACGLTIHTGVGCPYQCVYCYIYSMGFPKKISKYPLKPIELVYAIALNKNIFLGPYGTFLALGSVTEPFHPVTKEYTLELIYYLKKYLNNPIQVSTKAVIDEDVISMLRGIDKLSILYTIVSINFYNILEPYAPPPIDRFRSMELLVKNNIHTTMFIRPFIPGVTDIEIIDILEKGMEININKVIFGTLRVNKDILVSIKKSSNRVYNLIKEYLPSKIDDRQRVIRSKFIKKYLIEKALEYGYKVFPSACSALIDASNQSCSMCNFGPCGKLNNFPYIDEDIIREFLEDIGIRNFKISIEDFEIKITTKNKIEKDVIEFLKTFSRRNIKINLLK